MGILNKEGMVDIYINIKILGESKRFVETSVCEWLALQHTALKKWLACSLLLGDSESSTGSSSWLCLLTSDLVTQEVSETSVTSDLLQSFQILSELGVQGVGDQLGIVTVSDISLSVQEPFGNVIVYTLMVRKTGNLKSYCGKVYWKKH